MAGHPRRTPSRLGQEIATQLRNTLAARDISQNKIAERAGISASQLSRYLRGISSPTLEEYLGICHALDISAGAVLTNASIALRYGDSPDAGAEKIRQTQAFLNDLV